MVKKILANLINFAKENPTEALFALGSLALALSGKTTGVRVTTSVPCLIDNAPGMVISSLLNRARAATWDSDILRFATDVYNIAAKNPESKTQAIMALDKMASMATWNSNVAKITDMITKLA